MVRAVIDLKEKDLTMKNGSFRDINFNLIQYEEIVSKIDGFYPMSLVGRWAEVVKEAVNQGIDSHLEACFIPDRGDVYEASGNGRLECKVSPESMPVLLRRLFNSDDEDVNMLAQDILDTILNPGE